MSALTVDIAATDLTRLLAQVQRVDELILTQNGKAVARLLPVVAQQPAPKLAENPASSPPVFQVSQSGDALDREIAAFERQHSTLQQHYLHQYVALYQGKVIDHDTDQLTLLTRIDRQYPATAILVRKVVESLPKPLSVRSPRLRKAA